MVEISKVCLFSSGKKMFSASLFGIKLGVVKIGKNPPSEKDIEDTIQTRIKFEKECIREEKKRHFSCKKYAGKGMQGMW